MRVRVFARRVAVSTLLFAGSLIGAAAARGQGLPAPPAGPPRGPASGCTTNWYVSYGGSSSWTLINTDPDNLPLSALRFDRGYSAPLDPSKGFLDFDLDGKSDVFSAVPAGGGLYQWRFSSGGAGSWTDLASDTTPPGQLRFGAFNGNSHTDVFVAKPMAGFPGILQWMYSPHGTGAFLNLAHDSVSIEQLRFGDFDGDGVTDVFTLQDIGGGRSGWMVSYGGAASYVQVNAATTLLDEMQFGDINGDGTTDVFTTVPNTGLPGPGSYDWLYSPSATGAFQRTMVTLYTVHDVRLAGDFNGDHRSDWFFTTPKSAGLLQWWYEFYTGGAPPFGANMLAFDSTPADRLRFGDFDGDGITDVFTVVRSGDACVAPTTGLHTIAPCRLFDTRNDTGPDSASPILAAGEIRPMSLGGRCGIPDTAQTISVNVTVTGAGAAGDFTLYRADLSTAPVTANLSFGPGQTRASNGMLELDLNGGETFKVVNRSSAPAHFILDVNGYFM